MLKPRVIPCLDVKDGRVVKGVNFVDLRDAGDPVEAAKAYDAAGADELCFLDITASHERRGIILDVVTRTAEACFMPLTVGGGVRTLDDVRQLLLAGADKVSINTAAVRDPDFVRAASEKFGAQCIVVAIDAKQVVGDGANQEARSGEAATGTNKKPRRAESPTGTNQEPQSSAAATGTNQEPRSGDAATGKQNQEARRAESPTGTKKWSIFTHGGREPTGIDALEFAEKVVALGAGEILLTSMDRDGTKAGFDLALTRAVADRVSVPVIASGGVGTLDHLVEGITQGHANAVLAASIFHFGEYSIGDAKRHMAAAGVPMRLDGIDP